MHTDMLSKELGIEVLSSSRGKARIEHSCSASVALLVEEHRSIVEARAP